MEFRKLGVGAGELPWVRANYQILENGQAISSGTVSLGAIDPELYSLTVAHSDFVERGQAFAFRVTASNPVTHDAVRGAKILADLELDSTDDDEKHLQRSAITNFKGEAVIAYQVPDLDITEASLTLTGLSKRADEKQNEAQKLDISLSVHHRQRVLIQTDKQLFQPGQTVHIRALAIGPDRKMQSRRNLVLKVTDIENQDVLKEQLQTDRFGVASYDWKLDEHAELGTYQIGIGDDEDDDSGARSKNHSQITVSRYELPEFVVNAEPDRPYYLPDQAPAVKISSKYLFGKPVGEGHARLVREDSRQWNSKKQQWEVDSADELTGILDSQGELTLKPNTKQILQAFRDESYSRLRDLTYAAFVTDDTTGRTEQRRFFIRLTHEPIHIYVQKTGGDVHDGEYAISTQYPDGTPAECDVSLQHIIDFRGSDGSDNQVRKPVAQTHTNRYGLAKVRMRLDDESSDAHNVQITVEARDSRGARSHFDDSIYFARDEGAAIWISTNKTLLAADDPIAAVVHGKPGSLVEVDLLRDGIVLRSSELMLRKNSADVFFRKDERFHGEMELRAYSLNDASSYSIDTVSKRFLYPENRSLDVKFVGLPSVLHPGAVVQAGLKLNDTDGATPGVFGIAVTDKAVDERSRTETEFASEYQNWDYDFSNEVSGVKRSDLDRIDMSKPVPDGLDLVAERILSEEYGEGLRIKKDDTEAANAARSEFERTMTSNLRELAQAIDASNQDSTADLKILRKIAEERGVSPAVLLDPWQQPYRVQLSLEWNQYILTFKSAGADKIFDTRDDFLLPVLRRSIFSGNGNLLAAILSPEIATGNVPTSSDAVLKIAKRHSLDLASLRDPWGHPYRFETRLFKQWLSVYVYTQGEGRVEPNSNGYLAWNSSFDFFGKTEKQLSNALEAWRKKGHQFPHSEPEMFQAARDGGIDLTNLLDPLGKPYEIKFRDDQIYTSETQVSGAQGAASAKTVPVTRSVRILDILRSVQLEAVPYGTETEQNRVVAEFVQPYDRQSGRDIQPVKIDEGSFRSNTGAIGGTILDQTGAVVAGASIKVLLGGNGAAIETKSDSNGKFLLRDLKPGSYRISAVAPGFQTMELRDVMVSSASLTRVDVTLRVAYATETVEVTAEASSTLSTSSSVSTHSMRISTPAGSAVVQTLDFTPRLRHDFQETAYWAPALATNSSGRAQLHFKLPDNLTTWKVVAFGSTVDGKMGSAEREFQSFQPFFVDLDTPPVLTVGDQISPPVVLRNYGKSSATMDVSLASAPWFELLSPANTQATVPAGGSSSVDFSFRASNSTPAGKQRVTAKNHTDGDAIEKTVRVHPDGELRHVLAGGLVVDKSHPIVIHVPEDAIPGSLFTRLTVYPNLGSHITRSVEASLVRPYGCGEQTISSTYPSLLLLQLLQAAGKTSVYSVRAEKYVRQGYDRLMNYFDPSGGLTYWGREERKEKPDPALTAYGIEFLTDASSLIAVDETRISSARDWLLKTQLSDGSWEGHFGKGETSSVLFTALALARSANAGDTSAQKQPIEKAVRKAVAWSRLSAAAAESPYDVALELRIAAALHDPEAVTKAKEKLLALSDVDSRGRHWEIKASSPFYGWGHAGDLEATAMAVQALEESCSGPACENDPVIAESIYSLLRSKDEYGVWYSGQATVQVLRALFPLAKKQIHAQGEHLHAWINGKDLSDADVASLQPNAEIADAPRSLDISPYLVTGDNTIEITSDHGVAFASAQAISEYYIPWRDRDAREKSQPGKESGLQFGTHCNLSNLQVGAETQCFVSVKRFGASRWGMLLAEVGLPPGAEVERASLKQLISNGQISRYELQPDKLIFYLWSWRAEGEEFSFKMKLRYPVNAQSAASQLMDYYNPDLQVVLAPQKFTAVKLEGNYLAAASHER
ncbi:MAG TPA: alpha-2-macroglobulin family protein [Terriglobales bacterium]|nr:alpha-2-macroglobulin family protein [Terriglobales bacterium]